MKIYQFYDTMKKCLCGLVGSVFDHRSLPPIFESRRGHIWRVFHLWLRFITFGSRLAYLAYHVPKSGGQTSIIIIIIICLKEANLKLNVSKCTFAQTKIRFLSLMWYQAREFRLTQIKYALSRNSLILPIWSDLEGSWAYVFTTGLL